jgi:two-component system, NtrC family, nitrogen regulation sensor histidine kinase GlnL
MAMNYPDEALTQIQCRILDYQITAVLLFDAQLRLLYMNPAGEMLFAVSAQRLQGCQANEFLVDENLLKILHGVIESGQPVTERELSIHRIYSKRITVDLTALPLHDQQRTELLVEISQVDRQLRITREEGLLAQSHATRVLLRGLAHEIKNPLGGLRGAAQLLERQLNDEELKEYTQIIISEADRLQALMDKMLGPNTLPNRRIINLHEAIERVRQLAMAEISDGIRIRCDYDPSIPELEADLDQIIQAILNLVRNAIQALGDKGEITLRSRTLRQYTIGHTLHKLIARIDVIDDGPGIAPHMRESLFLPMVTGRADGTGLGLPIAQSMINANGGLIEWESQPGRTTFTILLPITQPRNTETTQ